MKKILAIAVAILLCLQAAPALASLYGMPSRGVGPCGALKGNIKIISLFVDTPSSSWTKSEIDSFYVGFWENTYEIQRQAARYGVELNLSAAWATTSTEYNVTDSGDADFNLRWYWDVMENYGFKNMQQMHDAWRGEYDDIAILFLFDEEGRCFSYPSQADDTWREEMAVYFTRSFPAGKIDHEFYHLFGAIDLYMPEEVTAAAKQYLGESIMMGVSENIDSYNAYMLGCTDYLDEAANGFHEAIRYVN